MGKETAMKNQSSSEFKMEVIVGAFVVLVFLGLGYFTIILSREAIFAPKHKIEVLFRNVMGLREGDDVIVRGMGVGKVKKLVLKQDGVHVVASLDERLRFRQRYRITVVSTSILGGRHLEIDEGPATDEEISESERALLQGTEPLDLMGDAAKAINAIQDGLTRGGVVTNIQSMAAQINQIATRVNAGKGTLGKLLSDDDTLYKDLSAGVASLRNLAERLEKGEGMLGKLLSKDDKMYNDLSAGVASLKSIVERVEKGEGLLGKLLKEDTVYSDLKATVASLKGIAERADKGEGTIGKLFSKDDKLYADLAATASSLRNTAERIEKGEGLLGKLIKDEKLFKDLQYAVGEARAALDDFRETAPVVTFTSIFFGVF